MSSVTRRRTSGLAIVLGGILALLGGQVREATGVPTLPFTDNFSASDGSELSADWTDRSGNITVVNNQATGSGPGKTNVSTVNGISAANVKIISTVALAAGQDVGLVTRYSGPQESNFYLGQLASTPRGFQATIWKNVGGTYERLAKGLTVDSGTGTLEFETVGPSLKVIFNGQLLAFVDDTGLNAAGAVGMRLSQHAALDSFQADAATQSPASLTFTDDFSTPSDGSQLSRFWTDQQGNITIVNGDATGTGHKANLSTLNGLSAADVTVSAGVALAAGEDVGLVARYSGPLESNFYLGQLASTPKGFQATIWKNVGGALTKLTKGLTVSSGTGTLTFDIHGSTLTLSLNGSVLATATDTDLVSGSVGLRLGEDATVSSFEASEPC